MVAIFYQLINCDIRAYGNIPRIAMFQEDYYTTRCLLDYSCFKESCQMISIDPSKQQAVNIDPKAILNEQIKFTGKIKFRQDLERAKNTSKVFLIEEVKETILDFSKGMVNVLKTCSMISIWKFILY